MPLPMLAGMALKFGAGKLMSKFMGGKGGGGQQYMQPQWLQNPEDAGAGEARDFNRDYTQSFMKDFQAGRDPMQDRADAQYQMEMSRIRRENYGQPGDRNNSLWGMAQQQMSVSGGFNPAQVLAQKKKFNRGMQNQFDDVRERIYGGATDWMRGASQDIIGKSNSLREGPAGQWSAGMMGGQPSSPDIGGVSSMIDEAAGAVGGYAKSAWGKYQDYRADSRTRKAGGIPMRNPNTAQGPQGFLTGYADGNRSTPEAI